MGRIQGQDQNIFQALDRYDNLAAPVAPLLAIKLIFMVLPMPVMILGFTLYIPLALMTEKDDSTSTHAWGQGSRQWCSACCFHDLGRIIDSDSCLKF